MVILGSVLCPPCKARQLMQTREEQINALCDNIIKKNLLIWPTIASIYPAFVISGDDIAKIRASENPRIKIALAIARFCENND